MAVFKRRYEKRWQLRVFRALLVIGWELLLFWLRDMTSDLTISNMLMCSIGIILLCETLHFIKETHGIAKAHNKPKTATKELVMPSSDRVIQEAINDYLAEKEKIT